MLPSRSDRRSASVPATYCRRMPDPIQRPRTTGKRRAARVSPPGSRKRTECIRATTRMKGRQPRRMVSMTHSSSTMPAASAPLPISRATSLTASSRRRSAFWRISPIAARAAAIRERATAPAFCCNTPPVLLRTARLKRHLPARSRLVRGRHALSSHRRRRARPVRSHLRGGRPSRRPDRPGLARRSRGQLRNRLVARSVEPVIRQIFIGRAGTASVGAPPTPPDFGGRGARSEEKALDGKGMHTAEAAFERRLLIIRRVVQNRIAALRLRTNRSSTSTVSPVGPSCTRAC